MDLVIVGVSGASSSGKSTVVKCLASVLPRCTVIHLDDFYFPDKHIPFDEKHQVQNWDCPEALDWDKFHQYLDSVRSSNGKILTLESLEIDSDMKLSDAQRIEVSSALDTQYADLKLCHVVLADGFMLYHDPAIASLFDVKLLFRAPYSVLKHRRESRQGYKTVEGFWIDPPGYFDNIVWPSYVSSHKYLFEQENVELSLAKPALRLGITDIMNDGSHDLVSLVLWAMKSICAGIQVNHS